jgi:hypothetical protein
MTAAMFVPAILFICLVWLHVTEGAMCGLYCLSTIPAMVVVMLYRVDDYGEPHLVNAASAPAS